MTGQEQTNELTKWQFWVDRGGTFTDIVARSPDGGLLTKKLLSENPKIYSDAALHGIREFLSLNPQDPIPFQRIESVKMGTTVATNALLERKGTPTVLAITRGLGDVLEIGYQERPETFALNIKKTELLYSRVVEIAERVRADGSVSQPLDIKNTFDGLKNAYNAGYRSIAIVLMHAYRYPKHEKIVEDIARKIGFQQISCSHTVSPLTRIVSRGDTTVVDAYLTPILRRYVDRISGSIIGENSKKNLFFMQSSGGLTSAEKFQGKDAILSGPAGGIVGAVVTSQIAGFDNIIGFDMGGTSTDVSHFDGEYERSYETEVAGVRMRVPMMHIHTVAAGGGSILRFEAGRFCVGPESAGADPGPLCYRRGGPLAVTDINVCLGKIHPDFFPKIFGPDHDQSIDVEATRRAFSEIAAQLGDGRSREEVAEGFLRIAVEHMAQAIKKISTSRGYNLRDYVMTCFGGAGGQHACLVAERLGIKKVFLHPFSGVLSAYGMGLADVRSQQQVSFEGQMNSQIMDELDTVITELKSLTGKDLSEQGIPPQQQSHNVHLLLRYDGTDTTLPIAYNGIAIMRNDFEQSHERQFGFISLERNIIIESIMVEAYGGREIANEPQLPLAGEPLPQPALITEMFSRESWYQTPVYLREELKPGLELNGPVIITESTGTIVVEPQWTARITDRNHLVMENVGKVQEQVSDLGETDPVLLEIFNNLFMSVAEQMGIVLRNTAHSVNVKERLDFSCAIFDQYGQLVANAPHVPVHLGSMGATVKVVVDSGYEIQSGDVFIHNNPYNGGSHLPDITVITPVFSANHREVLFYVASRAHHSDVGGITPGSMSPSARSLIEEGVVIDCMKLVERGVFQEGKIREVLENAPYPARNVSQNIADLKAQIAANQKGATELMKLVSSYGLETVHRYMQYIQDNAEQSVRSTLSSLSSGEFEYKMDSGSVIKVHIDIDQKLGKATIDFTGTSQQQQTNFNAPQAIAYAAVLYVFRCLVNDNIPLNAGCLKPLDIIVPEGSLLSPTYPAAVVAGNVEISQAVTNTLFGALGVLGSSQGTMNNLTFGNNKYQYYETICSGAPAGPGFHGAHAVHTHMTNSRLTDPEILELRYPVVLEKFEICRGSGGIGQWNAGDGVERKIRFLEQVECSILSSNRVVPPFGVKGGSEGQLGKNWVETAEKQIRPVAGCEQLQLRSGDAIVIRTPTGGGYGAWLGSCTK